MSVSQVRHFMEKSGCATVVTIAIGLVLVGGFIAQSCAKANSMSSANEEQKKAAVPAMLTVGEVPVTAADISDAREAVNKQFGSQNNTLEADAQMDGFALAQAIQAAANQALATKYKVQVTDDEVRKSVQDQLDMSVQMEKAQLVQSGKLKKEATDADFDAYVKAQTGKTVSEIKAMKVDEIFSKPETIAALRRQLIGKKVSEVLEKEAKFTDDDIKLSKATAEVQRIYVKDSTSKGKAQEIIGKAEADLKAGKAFGDVVAQYTEDVPEKGKDIKTATQTFSMGQAVTDKDYELLKKLKVGEVSGVLDLDGGYAIYKIIKLTPNVPKDFEKEKEQDRQMLASQYAGTLLRKEVNAMTAPEKIKWSNAGLELLYEVFMIPTHSEGNVEKANKLYAELLAKKVQVDPNDVMGTGAMAKARFLASSALWAKYTDAQKKEKASERIEILTAVLEGSEGIDVRLELANLLLDQKDKAAGENLLQAARSNLDYDQPGKTNFDKINELLAKLDKAGLVDAAQKADIEKAQKEWTDQKKETDKAKLEQEQEMERQRKEAEEQAKKDKAEAEKEAKEAKDKSTNAPSGSTGPKAPSAPGTSSSDLGGGGPSTSSPLNPSGGQ
ncbi:MAG: SurA N-terminal domain-containing protein [Armatimonadetes bacterium]|nr:SurA N-terminal domain-containing protein [Armatimonadota bacterium]